MKYNVLHNFISPVTGKIDGIYQLPDLQTGYVWLGNDLNRPFPTLLSDIITLPPLASGNIWIGNSDNIATPSQNIGLNNLPLLNTVSIAGYPTPLPQIYAGTSSGVPEISNSFAEAIADIFAINTKLLAGNFIMGDAIVQATWPGAQFLVNLEDGMLKKTGKVLQSAIPGTDYLPGITPAPPYPDEAVFLMYRSTQQSKNVYSSPLRFMDDVNTPFLIFDGGQINARRLQLSRAGGGDVVPDLGCEGDIRSNGEMSARGITLWDSKVVGHRLADGVTIMGPNPELPNNTLMRWYMPQKISTLGQVLKDVGGSPDLAFPNARTLGFGSVLPDNLQDGLLAQKTDGQNPPAIVNATLTKDKIWKGNEQNVPVEIDFNFAPNDATYILKTSSASLTNAQVLETLGSGIAKIVDGGAIAIAIADEDYATKATLEQIKAETEALKDEAAASATEAAASATEASASALEATGAAAEASGSAIAAGGSATAAGVSALAAAGSALSASSSSSSASSSASDASRSASNAGQSATNAAASATQANDYLNTLLTTGISLQGDVNGSGVLSSPITTSFIPNPKFEGTGYIKIPTGNIAERPGNPQVGMLRYNIQI